MHNILTVYALELVPQREISVIAFHVKLFEIQEYI